MAGKIKALMPPRAAIVWQGPGADPPNLDSQTGTWNRSPTFQISISALRTGFPRLGVGITTGPGVLAGHGAWC